jgi:purine nucleosidase
LTLSHTTRTLILDTDIGSDVDDAMALAQILGTPELRLDSVTTVYGDTKLRAQIARRYGALAGADLQVYAGEPAPLSGRPVWWPGHEGSLHEDLHTEPIPALPAVEHLLSALSHRPGELDVVAIGPLTNLARALELEPAVAGWIRHLWVMGGCFDRGEAEHNFQIDDVAAAAVFAAGIPSTVTGLEVTRQLAMRQTELDRIAAAGELGGALAADMQQWWEFWQETWNVPHDPVTVLTLTRPDLFTFSAPGTVRVAVGGDHAGSSRFVPDGTGRTRITTGVDGPAAAGAITSAIVASGHRTRGQVATPGGLRAPGPVGSRARS